MTSSKFQLSLAKDSQVQELRRKNNDLYQQNLTLRKSLEELIKVNTQLTQSIEEFNNANINNNQYQSNNAKSQREHQQNVEDMQNKIDTLTMEVQMLRKDIGGNGSNVYSHKSSIKNENDENMMIMIEQLLESFKVMQNKYQNQIHQLYDEINNYKSQWQELLFAIGNKSEDKIKQFDNLLNQMKRKDQLVAQIQRKVKSLENSSQGLNVAKNQLDSKTLAQIKANNQKTIEQKNKTIKLYKDLVEKLRLKIIEKY